MEITEKERLMLVRDKESICGATLAILELLTDPKNAVEIEQKFSIILQLLNTIASYSDPKNYDLNRYTEGVNALFDLMSREKQMKIWLLSPKAIKRMCNYANSVRFDFTDKKGLKITLPKINLNFGNVTNQ
jgi:hypothetical protein